MSDLSDRLDAAERAVIGLGSVELGDVESHPFHGNQYSGGSGSDADTTEPSPAAVAIDYFKSTMAETEDPEEALSQLTEMLTEATEGLDAEVYKSMGDLVRDLADAAGVGPIKTQTDPAFNGQDSYGLRLAGPGGKTTVMFEPGLPPEPEEIIHAVLEVGGK